MVDISLDFPWNAIYSQFSEFSKHETTTYYDDALKLSEISMDLKEAMEGLEISEIPDEQLMQNRGW